MSVVFKIVAVKIPKSFTEEQTKEFFNTHTQLKVHAKPDQSDEYWIHFQSKRKKNLDLSFNVKCNDQQHIELVCSHDNLKNKFKLNKMKQRGDVNLAGRPKKVVECDKQHIEESAPQIEVKVE